MPTGYTNMILEGATFEKFVLGCARAFGALVSMRDHSHDAPITIKSKHVPSDYRTHALATAKADLKKYKGMGAEEFAIAADKDYQESLKRYDKYIKKANKDRKVYDKMLLQVNEWTPPTSDHRELKTFMVEQITKTIEHDCRTDYWVESRRAVKPQSGEKYRMELIETAERDIEIQIEGLKDDKEGDTDRTEWIKELFQSLDVEVPIEQV